MQTIRAGALRTPFQLQAKAETSDDQGGTTHTWRTIARIWGSAVPLDHAGETREADATVSRRRYTVTVRRRVPLSAAMRLVNGTQRLEILSVIDSTEFRDGFLLDCRDAIPAEGR